MAFLAPTLITPLLKVPLLVGNAVCTYYGLSQPGRPASAEDVKRIGSTYDFLSKSKVPALVKGGVIASNVCSEFLIRELTQRLTYHHLRPKRWCFAAPHWQRQQS